MKIVASGFFYVNNIVYISSIILIIKTKTSKIMNNSKEIKEAIKFTNAVIAEREELMPEDMTGMTRSLKAQVRKLELMLDTLAKPQIN